MKNLRNKYLNLNFWYLYTINIVIYVLAMFIENKFILNEDYYLKYLRPQFHSDDDYLNALVDSHLTDLYNYLWIPMHLAIQGILISLCIFVGFNACNYYLSWKNSVKATFSSILIFTLNNLVVTILKATNTISYNAETVDDIYFFQSIGRLFINKNLSDFIYELLEKVNIIEMLFCLVFAYTINRYIRLRYAKALFLTTTIYVFGTIIFVCVMRFCAFLF